MITINPELINISVEILEPNVVLSNTITIDDFETINVEMLESIVSNYITINPELINISAVALESTIILNKTITIDDFETINIQGIEPTSIQINKTIKPDVINISVDCNNPTIVSSFGIIKFSFTKNSITTTFVKESITKTFTKDSITTTFYAE